MVDTLNIVVTGKSGVGKSSFLNYLLGKEVFKTGIGEPVTKTYFDKREMPKNEQGVRYVLYDTKGIEPTTVKECRDNIFYTIEYKDTNPNFFEWIHSIYYCFDCTASRIEPFEYNFIKDLSRKAFVIVLLTKSDKVEKWRIDALSKEIRDKTSSSIQIIPVCSVESKGTRKNPTPVHQFGREEVLKASFYGLWNKIATIIPHKSVQEIQDYVDRIKPLSSDELMDDLIKLHHNEPNIILLNRLEIILKQLNVNPSREVYDKVVNFYKKVNRFSPQLFFITESQNAFNDLRNYNVSHDISNILSKLDNIHFALIELKDCVFWDNAERKVLRKEIEHYTDAIKDIKHKFQEKIDRFVSNYKSELLQYGRLCISSEKIECSTFDSMNDLSKEENIYARLIQFIISNGYISVSERKILNKLREELQISELKAGRIEDYIRNQ